MIPLLEETKWAGSMPTQSLPKNEEFQILWNFPFFCEFLEKKLGKSKDWEQIENFIAKWWMIAKLLIATQDC